MFNSDFEKNSNITIDIKVISLKNTINIKLCVHVSNGFIGLQNVYLDTNNIILLHIVTKILAFKESHFSKWPPRSPGDASGLVLI